MMWWWELASLVVVACVAELQYKYRYKYCYQQDSLTAKIQLRTAAQNFEFAESCQINTISQGKSILFRFEMEFSSFIP